MQIKVALPKGRLLDGTAALLQRGDWQLDGYQEKARLYHFKSGRFPNLALKMFHEKDIPIQVAVGNYDLGICGQDWVEELRVKYPSSALVKLESLGYGSIGLFIVASQCGPFSDLGSVKASKGVARIASEYPNLAEAFALRQRLSRFSIFPVWGGAEAYPPDSAELALVPASSEAELVCRGLVVLDRVLDCGAMLVVNQGSWVTKDLGAVLAAICENCGPTLDITPEPPYALMLEDGGSAFPEGTVRIALPDGHQQQPAAGLLARAGIKIEDYPSAESNRRPKIKLKGFAAKVIRPQDMPLQVANGNFDLAITGRDWVREHLYQFPSSPIREILDLKFGAVRIVSVVSQSLPVADNSDLRALSASRSLPLRLASEYVNIADKYARDNHFGHYRVVPTWGATEAFLPEDADMLIENTQTGQTIARHNLKIIDTLFESTACLIGNASAEQGEKSRLIDSFVETLRRGVEAQ